MKVSFLLPLPSSSTVENGGETVQEQRIRSRERIHAVNNYGREQDNGWKTSSNCLLPKTTIPLNASRRALKLSTTTILWPKRFCPIYTVVRRHRLERNLRSVFNFISLLLRILYLQWNIAQKFPNATIEIFVKKGNVRIDSWRNWNSISSSTY